MKIYGVALAIIIIGLVTFNQGMEAQTVPTHIQLERAEFHVQAIGNSCHPQLIFHGDFTELHQAVLNGEITRSFSRVDDFKVVDKPQWTGAYFALIFYGNSNFNDFETLLGPNSYTLTASIGRTKNELAQYPIQYRESYVTDQYYLKFKVNEDGLEYFVESNKVKVPNKLLTPKLEFDACISELERREEAIASEYTRIAENNRIKIQLEIHTADRDFYISEIEKYEEAIATLKPIIAEANRIRDEALAQAIKLQVIYKTYLEMLQTFWNDTEVAYVDYFTTIIDNSVEINSIVDEMDTTIESVESMQSEIEILITDAESKANKAANEIKELGE